jgi:ABC-2 type transport system permease protein
MAETVLSMRLAPWSFWRETLRAVWLLGAREVRLAFRTPAYLLPNLVIPIFFYFVMVGSLEEFAGQSGLTNWEAFQLPVAIIFAVQGGSAGLNMVADIESGYFDKLLLTPANRLSMLIGAMGADFLRIMARPASSS